MNRTRYIALLCFGLFLVVSAYIYLAFIANYPAAQAKLTVRSGRAKITRAAGQSESVEAGGETLVGANDTIQMADGEGTLIFAGALDELEPGTQIQIGLYGASGNEAQIELAIKAGQVRQQIIGYADRRSLYRLTSPNGTLETRGGEAVVRLNDSQTLEIGTLSGLVTISAQGKSVMLTENQGTVVAPGQPPVAASLWSRVLVETFRPDGSPVTLPVILLNSKSGDTFQVYSQQLAVVPEGEYRLTIDLLKPFEVSDLSLTTGALNEAPITLSEIVFTVTTVDGKPTAYTALNVQGSSTLRALPQTAVLISPGKWNILAAREEKPDKIQPVPVDLLPGQRITIPLRNDLFGGGTVQVHLTAFDGSTAAPVDVAVYPQGAEANPPLLTFRTDSPPQPLPEGAYAISVRTPIAARYEVNVSQSQNTRLQTSLGSITVNYSDAQGKPFQGNVIAFIASANDMQRLALPIDQMRQTPYGMAVSVGTRVIVPAGLYNVTVNDQKTASQSGVRVDAGQVVSVDLKAGS